MWSNFKAAIHRAGERRRYRRGYQHLLVRENEFLLRDIGIDRFEVQGFYRQTGAR